jgi:hypothetical protein
VDYHGGRVKEDNIGEYLLTAIPVSEQLKYASKHIGKYPDWRSAADGWHQGYVMLSEYLANKKDSKLNEFAPPEEQGKYIRIIERLEFFNGSLFDRLKSSILNKRPTPPFMNEYLFKIEHTKDKKFRMEILLGDDQTRWNCQTLAKLANFIDDSFGLVGIEKIPAIASDSGDVLFPASQREHRIRFSEYEFCDNLKTPEKSKERYSTFLKYKWEHYNENTNCPKEKKISDVFTEGKKMLLRVRYEHRMGDDSYFITCVKIRKSVQKEGFQKLIAKHGHLPLPIAPQEKSPH